jgi:hypothetical protein
MMRTVCSTARLAHFCLLADVSSPFSSACIPSSLVASLPPTAAGWYFHQATLSVCRPRPVGPWCTVGRLSRWIQKCADIFEEQWKGIVHVVEDTSVVDVALADLSSTKVGCVCVLMLIGWNGRSMQRATSSCAAAGGAPVAVGGTYRSQGKSSPCPRSRCTSLLLHTLPLID